MQNSMQIRVCVIIVISVVFPQPFSSEEVQVYTNKTNATEWGFSPVIIEELALEERQIYKLMLHYRDSLLTRVKLLESYADDFEEGRNITDIWQYVGLDRTDAIKTDQLVKAEAISSNPLMVFRMIRRFAYNIKQIKDHIESMPEQTLLSRLSSLVSKFEMPGPSELHDVMDNVLRIQDVYELKAEDLINGILAGRDTGYGLTVSQAFSFTKHALSTELFCLAFDWVNAVLFELNVNPHQGLAYKEVSKTLTEIVEKHDDLQDLVNETNYYDLSLNRFTDKLSEDTLAPESIRRRIQHVYADIGGHLPFSFMDTCEGVKVMPSANKSKQLCRYEHALDPAWIINPLKLEIYSWDPYVVQIHEAIGEKSIRYLKEKSLADLGRSTVVVDAYGESPTDNSIGITSGSRTSAQAFIYEKNDELLLRLEKQAGLLTGLKVDNLDNNGTYGWILASEAIQVAVYGTGCHFSEHLDALQRGENETAAGDRIATLMFYLNDVKLGGETAFPLLGFVVPPVKGSALFWYDLKRNGVIDERMMHGGCPVILGRKWIANKWIRLNANFHKRPCSLDSNE